MSHQETILEFPSPKVIGEFNVEKAANLASRIEYRRMHLGASAIDEEQQLREIDLRIRTEGLEALGLSDINADELLSRFKIRVTTLSRDQEFRSLALGGNIEERLNDMWHFDRYVVYDEIGIHLETGPERIAFGSTDKQIEMVFGKIALPVDYDQTCFYRSQNGFELTEMDHAIDDAIENKTAHIFSMEAGQIAVMPKPLPHRRSSQVQTEAQRLTVKALVDEYDGAAVL